MSCNNYNGIDNSYIDYISKSITKSIEFSEYVAKNLDQTINYAEYLAESLDTTYSNNKKKMEIREENINKIFNID